MSKPLFPRIAVIGLGLIGSSIARAAHERGLAKIIVGCDANEISLAYAKKHGFIGVASSNPAEAVKGADFVILATPPSTLAGIAEIIAPHLDKGVIVMDVCSVKQPAIDAISPHLKGVDFIPAHPIAGSEQSGVGAGRADLFERKYVIVTPAEPLHNHALQTVTAFWQAMGARLEAMPAALHDLVYAHVSHLPQLLAFAAAGVLADYKDDKNLQKFLRLSGSNPAMWTEILILNKINIIKALDRYLDAISHIKNELVNAPEGSINESDTNLAHTTLFPRIAASCLITTVMEAEKLAGFPFGRYAGTGFADFTNPAALPPENDIEQISGQYAAVAGVLDAYIIGLKEIYAALNSDDNGRLKKILGKA